MKILSSYSIEGGAGKTALPAIPIAAEIERMGLHRKPVLAYAHPQSPAWAYRDLCAEVVRMEEEL